MSETEIQSLKLTKAETAAKPAQSPAARVCPFREGPETLDLLLAEMGAADTDLLDAALDLRSFMAAGENAGACLQQLCHLRSLLDGRHYLAFYRVRCWVQRHLRAEVRAHRGTPWIAVALPRDCGRLDAVVNACLASLATDSEGWLETARVRFRFATEVELAAGSTSEPSPLY